MPEPWEMAVQGYDPVTGERADQYRQRTLPDGLVITEAWQPGWTDPETGITMPGRWVVINEYRSPGGGGAPPTYYDPNSIPPGYVPVYDTYGNVVDIMPAKEPALPPSYYGGNIPTGYVPIYDNQGNIVDIKLDPTYQQPSAPKQPPTYLGELPPGFVPIKDVAGNTISYELAPKASQLPGTKIQAEPGLPGLYTIRDAQGNILDTGGTYDPDSDRYFLEKVRQFDATLAAQIQSDQMSLQRLMIAESGANARQAASIAASMAELQMRIKSEKELAAQRIAAAWRENVLGAAVNVRGQDVAMRGQDVSREGNILQAMQARAQYGIEALKNDPVAQAIYFYGESPTGKMTPAQYGMQQFQIPKLPTIGSVGPLNPNVAQGFRGGGSVVRSDQPVLSIVGDSDPRAAEAALLPPGSAIEPLRLGKNASKADMQRAALRAYPRLQKRLASFQGGGYVLPKPQGQTLAESGWKPPSLPGVTQPMYESQAQYQPFPYAAGQVMDDPFAPPKMGYKAPYTVDTGKGYKQSFLGDWGPSGPGQALIGGMPMRLKSNSLGQMYWAPITELMGPNFQGIGFAGGVGQGVIPKEHEGFPVGSQNITADPSFVEFPGYPEGVPQRNVTSGYRGYTPPRRMAPTEAPPLPEAPTPTRTDALQLRHEAENIFATLVRTPLPFPELGVPLTGATAKDAQDKLAQAQAIEDAIRGGTGIGGDDYTLGWQNPPQGWTWMIDQNTGILLFRGPDGMWRQFDPTRPPPWAETTTEGVVAFQRGGTVTPPAPTLPRTRTYPGVAEPPPVVPPVEPLPPTPTGPPEGWTQYDPWQGRGEGRGSRGGRGRRNEPLTWQSPTGQLFTGVSPWLTATPPTEPTPAAPAPIPLTPEDAILYGRSGYGGSEGYGGYSGGSTFTNQADLDAARKTFADLLAKAMSGQTMPAAGALPPAEPIYGVGLTQPEQLASRFWNMPYAARNLVTSAWGVRNMPQEEFYRRMAAVTPSATEPFNVAWGRRGLAVLPRRIAA